MSPGHHGAPTPSSGKHSRSRKINLAAVITIAVLVFVVVGLSIGMYFLDRKK